MNVRVAAGILTCIFCTTLFIYVFGTPEELQTMVKSDDSSGRWGIPNSDFNWCEPNYTYSSFVAEPWNTFSSLLYCLVPILVYRWHKPILTLKHLGLLLFTFCIGVGSTLFHATLWYSFQLWDELPMFWLSTFAASISYQAISRADFMGINSHMIVAICDTIVSFGIIFSSRYSMIHEVSRAVMSIIFSIAFLGVLLSGIHLEKKINTAILERRYKILQKVSGEWKESRTIEIFTLSFYIFVFGLLSWILDNFCCQWLQSFPVGYLQLHAVGWHFGTALGLYLQFVGTIVFDTLQSSPSSHIFIHYRYKILPVIRKHKPLEEQSNS